MVIDAGMTYKTGRLSRIDRSSSGGSRGGSKGSMEPPFALNNDIHKLY